MKKIFKIFTALLFLTVYVGETFAENSVTETEFSFATRVRYESVKQAALSAEALTVKLRLDASKKLTNSLSLFLQLDYVQAYLNDQHSDGVVFIDKPVIADPAGIDVNQAFVNYSFDDYFFTLGRQSIKHGNERFVGDVGFRQNDQTYDGLRITKLLLSGVSFDYAYISQVNRIFGRDADSSLSTSDIRFIPLKGKRPVGQLGKHDVNAHLLNLEFKEWQYADLSAYAYVVDNYDAVLFSNRTFGFSSNFRHKIGAIKWIGSIESAWQKKQKSTTRDWINYWQWELGAKVQSWQLSIRQEQLGQKDDEAFITPLATLHKFQGWTDQFLTTPKEGLMDASVRLLWKKRPFTLDLRLHQYDSVKNNIDVGSEFNADLIYQYNRKHELKLRFAYFDPSNAQTLKTQRIKKLFLMYSYNL
ncbi:alginate export family protein [Colwellia sp. Bg11-28]|uniref:alginate export family protein n=1 Tax=Colwellia sp. Bg11-28 TaxID=2058305 RepID=UPI000C34F1E5|nr:alginate export family protein [Colwellia sp. Bg11-28]PKH89218.1 hypothetical protein CXF79_00015 [Colwellia sp. Bg11-28]